MKLSDYLDFGYGPAEFKRDVHVAWTVVGAYLIVRIPEINSYSLEQFKGDCLQVAAIAVVAVLKSSLMRTPVDPPVEKKP